MFCPMCGQQVQPGTAFCAHCGKPVGSAAPPQQPQPQYMPPPAAPGPQAAYGQPYQPYQTVTQDIPNYMVQAVLVTLLCCLPLGIAAIVKASSVDRLKGLGDLQGATRASQEAKNLCIASLAIGLVIGVIAIVANM